MEIRIGDETCRLDPDGGLFWPRHGLLAVADIHLEKGSAFARRGMPIPPYDTDATLERLAAMMARHRPSLLISMGDAFHDRHGPWSLPPASRDRLEILISSTRWIWLAGNHDPSPWEGLGGRAATTFSLDGLHFVHAPGSTRDGFEIAGHLHPKARLRGRSLGVSRPCFALGSDRLIMPAFGAYTGGLNVLDPAIASWFEGAFEAILLGDRKLYRLPSTRLTPDPPRWQLIDEER
jgi:DNA ligase-associated metallophosphoesterase